MTPATVDILIDCDSEFRLPARYVFVLFGLISGFKPRFIRPSDMHARAVYYGKAPETAPAGALCIPASSQGHRSLTRKLAADIGEVRDTELFGHACLSLFPVAGVPGSPHRGGETNAPTLGFDLVAAAFYFLSLHEEWCSERRDRFDRFQAKDSLLGARGMLDRPVVAEYAAALADLLVSAGRTVERTPRYAGTQAAVCITHDIDYLSKRTPGLLWRECVEYFLLNGRAVSLRMRAERLKEYFRFFGPGRDPYRSSIQAFLEQEQRKGIRATYFIKTGGEDKRDVSYNAGSRFVRSLIGTMAANGDETGLHPSFRTYRDSARMRRERDRLAAILRAEVKSVRQHYLRLEYPGTWNAQSELGFSIDSSLGFAEQEGFRNGTCHPFLPFDLDRMRPIPIWEVPLHSMDGTYAFYRNMAPDAAVDAMRRQFETVRSHGGVWTVLFHNTVYDGHDFPGWDRAYLRILEEIEASGCHAQTLNSTVESWIHSSPFSSLKEIIDTINS